MRIVIGARDAMEKRPCLVRTERSNIIGLKPWLWETYNMEAQWYVIEGECPDPAFGAYWRVAADLGKYELLTGGCCYLEDWEINHYPTGAGAGDYLSINRLDRPGTIQIKMEDEGYVVDIWDAAEMDSIASCAATYDELRAKEEE